LILACLTFTTFAILVPHYLSVMNVQQLMRDFAEPGLVAVAMSITILAGGIDLSVGATFALADFVALYLFRIQGLSPSVAIAGAVATGVAVGTLNGLLIAYVKARPFLTTLATLLILRAAFNLVSEAYTTELAIATNETALGFPGRRFDTGCSGEHVGALRGRARQPRFSHPHSPGSAYHGRGRKPQSGAPRRDRRAPLAAVGLYSERS